MPQQTGLMFNQFPTETAQDEELALLKHIVQTEWPHDICDLPKEIQPYWTFHEEMTIEDGLLLKGTHIIIPQTLLKEMIQLIHTGHLGLEKCLNRVKQYMYWPGLYDELKDLITSCTTCLKFSAWKPTSNKQNAGHEIPVHPWSKLASDIFYFEGDSYLPIVDYTPHFPIIRNFSSMTGKAIAHHMQSIFSKYGWPNTLVTDNGPCYTSKEFQILMQSMSVNHLTSSPHYLQSNGLAEKFVGIIKNLFHKAKEEGQSPYTVLMVYRNTPLNGTLQSPMQNLQGTQACTDLPLSHAAKVQMGINHAPWPTAEILHVKDKLLSSPTHDIPIGQNVMYREPNDKRWYPATVIQQLPEKRSYFIRTKDNAVYRNTQVHLKPYTSKKKIEPPELYKEDNEQSLDNYQCVNNEQSLDNNQSMKINQDLNIILNCQTD